MAYNESFVLDTPAALERFHAEYYYITYNQALEITGSPAEAKALTVRVMDSVARRFRQQPIPPNCEMYLAAQTYLLHSRKFTTAETPAPAAVQPVSKAIPVESAPIDPIRAAAAAAHSNVAAHAAGAASPPPPTAPGLDVSAAPEAKRGPAQSEPASVFENPPIEPDGDLSRDAIYDADQTIYWVSNSEDRSIPGENKPSYEEAEPLEAEKHSDVLSVVNTFLVLVLLVSVAFLLIEANVFFKVF